MRILFVLLILIFSQGVQSAVLLQCTVSNKIYTTSDTLALCYAQTDYAQSYTYYISGAYKYCTTAQTNLQQCNKYINPLLSGAAQYVSTCPSGTAPDSNRVCQPTGPSVCTSGQIPSVAGCIRPEYSNPLCNDTATYTCFYNTQSADWHLVINCSATTMNYDQSTCVEADGSIHLSASSQQSDFDADGWPSCGAGWSWSDVSATCVIDRAAFGLSTFCSSGSPDQYGLCSSDYSESCQSGQWWDGSQCRSIASASWVSATISSISGTGASSAGGVPTGGGSGGTTASPSPGGGSSGTSSPSTDQTTNEPPQTVGADDTTPIDGSKDTGYLDALTGMTKDLWNAFTGSYLNDPNATNASAMQSHLFSNQDAVGNYVDAMGESGDSSPVGYAPYFSNSIVSAFSTGGSSCAVLDVQFHGGSGDLLSSFCPVWESSGRPILGWFFYIVTLMGIFSIWTTASKS